MEIIKDLPEVFEEFAEQRKNSFLAVKELKDKGVPIVGSYCTYFPQELAMAMGAASVSLCSTSDETIAEAEKELPKNLCPLIKSSYGFARTDKCPFFYFSDVVVGETTCDGKKKMYLAQAYRYSHSYRDDDMNIKQQVLEKNTGVLLIRELPDTIRLKETESEAYCAVWDLMIQLEKELPMAFVFYGQDSLVEQNNRYDELGIFLPNSHFLKNLERHAAKAEAIIYG